MKINILKSIVLTGVLLMSVSCDNFLEVENEGAFIPETVLSNPNGAGQLLNGVYQGFFAIGNWDYRFGCWYYSIPGTDIGFERPGTPAFRQAVDRYAIDGTNGNLPGGKFRMAFIVIGRANQLLSVLPDAELEEDLRFRTEAEARFYRAYAYFDAVRTFGGLPIATSAPSTVGEAIELSNLAGDRASVQEVFEQVIIPDFEFAAEHLPEQERLPGTPNVWAAKALLAKSYMQAAGQFKLTASSGSYWALAIPLLQDVINNGPYSLIPGPDYSQIYDVDFENNNPEKIWTLKYLRNNPPDGFAMFWFGPQNYGENDEIYLQDPSRRVFPTTNSFGGGRQNLQVYESFYNSFDPADLRRDVAIRDYTFNMTDNDGNLLTGNTRWPWGVNKYNYDAVAFAESSRDGTDRIIMRLADVYLLLAEAINEENGPTADAFAAINTVRQRAGLADLTAGDMIDGHFTYTNGAQSLGSTEGFRFAVLRERAWELCYEYQRRFDLIRHHYLDEVALNRWDAPGDLPTNKNYPPILSAFTEGWELFPIPNDQIELNGWQQNPGY